MEKLFTWCKGLHPLLPEGLEALLLLEILRVDNFLQEMLCIWDPWPFLLDLWLPKALFNLHLSKVYLEVVFVSLEGI